MDIMKVVFCYGRFNPPTKGHKRLMETLCNEANASDASVRFYMSETHDSEKNPLDAETKLNVMKQIFPDQEVRIARNLRIAIDEILSEGFDEAIFYCGADRYETFKAMENPKEPQFKTMTVKMINRSNEDVSASKARQAARDNDWKSFCEFSASNDEIINNRIFVDLRKSLGVE